MIKKLFVMIFFMIFIFITPLSSENCPYENQTEWIERYKDPNICIYTKYIENKVYFDVVSEVDYELEMYDIFGRKVFDLVISNQISTNFNKTIPKGIYCLRIINRGRTFIQFN